jgi:hypothetical protein
MSNMTAGMSPETAFPVAINRRAWPIMTELVWRSTGLLLEAGSLRHESTLTIPHLLRPPDESHLPWAECFDSSCYDLYAFKQGVSFVPRTNTFWLWVVDLGFKSLCLSILRQVTRRDERSSRFAPASYPILLLDLVELMVVFCLSKFDTPACIPHFFFWRRWNRRQGRN